MELGRICLHRPFTGRYMGGHNRQTFVVRLDRADGMGVDRSTLLFRRFTMRRVVVACIVAPIISAAQIFCARPVSGRQRVIRTPSRGDDMRKLPQSSLDNPFERRGCSEPGRHCQSTINHGAVLETVFAFQP